MGTGKHKHNKKGGGNGGGGGEAAPVTDDPRFASMHSAPVSEMSGAPVDRAEGQPQAAMAPHTNDIPSHRISYALHPPDRRSNASRRTSGASASTRGSRPCSPTTASGPSTVRALRACVPVIHSRSGG